MKKLIGILTVLFILTSYTSFAQFGLDMDRKQTTESFDVKKITLTTTDSTLIFQRDAPKFKTSKRIFHFDNNGKCDWIVSTFECERCYLWSLNQFIKSKRDRWAQLDSLTYVSDKLKVELRKGYQNKPYSYIIKRIGN